MPVVVMEGEDRRRTARTAVDAALSPSLQARIRQAGLVFIKTHLGPEGLTLASVAPETVRGVIDVVRMYSDAPIVIADAAERDTEVAMLEMGYDELKRTTKNTYLVDMHREPSFTHEVSLGEGSIMARRASLLKEAHVTIAVTPMLMSSHFGPRLGMVTFAEGTWLVPARQRVDGNVYARGPWYDAYASDIAHDVVAQLYAAQPADITLIDSVMVLREDNGLRKPIPLGVMIAGDDPVATDSVGALIMGYDPESVPYLVRTAAFGCGTTDLATADVSPHILDDLMRRYAE